jgi:hypothetical protein
LIFRNSGFFCSFEPKSMAVISYGNPSSSNVMEAFHPALDNREGLKAGRRLSRSPYDPRHVPRDLLCVSCTVQYQA